MPAYRRYRRAGYRRRRRYYGRRRYYRRYGRRYINASSRSSIRIKCNQTYSGTAVVGYGNDGTGAVVVQIRPYANSADRAVTTNPLYIAYHNLYEETKMIGMKVVLSITSQVGGQDTPSLQIYSSWDRRHGEPEAIETVAGIKGAATSNVATALNNNVAKVSRSIYASDLIEKAQWHDSSFDANGNDAAWVAAGANPNFFCPTFFAFFNSPSLGATHNISYSASITYYCAFRNPKYGGSASSSKDLPAKPVIFPGEDGDVDDPMWQDVEINDSGDQSSAAADSAQPVAKKARIDDSSVPVQKN